ALFAAALAGCDTGGSELVASVAGRRELVHGGAPPTAHVTDPALALAPDGAPHLAWIRRDGAEESVRTAVIDGADPADAAGVRVDPPERPVAGGPHPPRPPRGRGPPGTPRGGRPPAAGSRDRRGRPCARGLAVAAAPRGRLAVRVRSRARD